MLVKKDDVRIQTIEERPEVAVLNELKRIYKANEDGKLMPEEVVEAARHPDSPLHSKFEWDDSVAAENYRLNQARTLIVRFKVQIDKALPPQRVFISVMEDRKSTGGYSESLDVLKHRKPAARQTALLELDQWARRHELFCEDIVAAVRKSVAKFQ